jgi:hypothetical protein
MATTHDSAMPQLQLSRIRTTSVKVVSRKTIPNQQRYKRVMLNQYFEGF